VVAAESGLGSLESCRFYVHPWVVVVVVADLVRE